MERCVRLEEAWSAWQSAGPGGMVWLAPEAALPRIEALLGEQQVAVKRLGRELLARLPEPEALVGQESRGPGDRPNGAARQALQEAFALLVAEWRTEDGPLALRDLELAVAERLDLALLADLRRPWLLLVPGRRHGSSARLFETPQQAGVPLPPALAGADRVLTVEAPDAPREGS